MMRKILLSAAFCIPAISAWMQVQPLTGIKDEKHTSYVFTHAIIHVSSTTVLQDAGMVIRDGQIVETGTKVHIPADAKEIDCTGKHIYASFIETWSSYGLSPEGALPSNTNYYWNDAIKTHYQAYTHYAHQKEEAARLRSYGIGTVLTHQMDGILRGTASLVTLADYNTGKNILVENAAWFGSLEKGTAKNDYPNSLTGTFALIRQFLYDAQWYAAMKGKAEKSVSMDTYNRLKELPVFFKVANKSDIFRLEKIAREFDLHFHYIGNGDEYKRVNDLKNISSTVIVPVTYTKPYLLNDAYDADMISMEDLLHWDMAPANLHILDSNKIPYLITPAGFEQQDMFFSTLYKTIQYGLPKEKALYALTEGPAKLLQADGLLGTLEKGKLANFIITAKELGEENWTVLENWVQGQPYMINANAERKDLRGTYTIQSDFAFVNNKTLLVKGEVYGPVAFLNYSDTIKLPMDIRLEKNLVTSTIYSNGLSGYIRIAAYIGQDKTWTGQIESPKGEKFNFTMRFSAPYVPDEEEEKDPVVIEYTPTRYPNKAYGWRKGELEEREGKSYLVKNVTVWTNEKEGILQGQDVITANGKIKKIGTGLSCNDCITIDGTGMHLTSGVIDEHSHIALTRGVNEGGQSSSAEVRMGDVLNAEDINIYRQLSGGVTIAQLLHGSANAIGGQSAIIKLRWGKNEEGLLMEGAPPFIKFALGENVKQSNWGENTSRYPKTRMGVEQFYFEMFHRAKEYAEKKKSSKEPVRKDLELEILNEILDGKRYITCHSYIQSEINMLIHVADSMGFKVNTFTHILEGYKVADKMKEHGSNASTFADWWAYKFEVNDAIPYNAAILTKSGINTSVNSDDAEMARRLNHEAAKAVKYGGLTEEEAWKLCTLNPAKMLHIDDKVGSVKEGKQADLVLWSANPLSIYARVKFTMIDGTIYYDEDHDKAIREFDQKEKQRLVQKMMKAVREGAPAVPIAKRQYFEYDCESLENTDYETIQTID